MYGKIRLSLLAGLFTVFPALAADDHGTVAFPIEFGRMVETGRVVLYLLKLPSQEKTWSSATLEFSNGHKIPIPLKNTAAAQEFVFPNQLTAWVKLTELRETSPLGDNGVTEWEVYGKDIE